MGFFSKSMTGNLFDPLDLTGRNSQDRQDTLQDSSDASQNRIGTAYDTARETLKTGSEQAQNTARTGFQTARTDTTAGYGRARNELNTGGREAIDTARKGFQEAQGRYDTKEMVASRDELYRRILGGGGLDANTLEKMKAGTREEYGTGLRGAEQALNSYAGDSEARGLAGENLARTASDLGAKRANAVRDIDVGNEELKRSEMTGAIASTQEEAYQRAGLSAQEATAISGLEMRLAEGGANLTAQETNALATIASQEGITVAELQQALATGQANLTTEQAQVLANISMGTAQNIVSMQASSGLGGHLGG